MTDRDPNPIFVRYRMRPPMGRWEWTCTRCVPVFHSRSYGFKPTIAAAVDAGREHLRDVHGVGWFPTTGGYCRTHGCSRSECGCASTPVQPAKAPEALGDPNGFKVAQILAARPRTGDSSPLHRSHNEGIGR